MVAATGPEARGIHLLPVVPANGAEIRDAGKSWRCQWTGGGIGRLQPMPAWVADALDGPPPDAENRRVGWALSHIREDTAARNTRRLATLHRRRYDPWELHGTV
jgi:hypothetical protein